MCPCTDASLAELRVLLSGAAGQVTTVVAFGVPTDRRDQWADSRAWRTARGLAGAEPFIDDDQLEAHRFGARTSGQVLLYGREGDLLFSGGITLARGHEGENEGLTRLTAALESGLASKSSPVFGCPLETERARGQAQ
jgi:hypothetical protein